MDLILIMERVFEVNARIRLPMSARFHRPINRPSNIPKQFFCSEKSLDHFIVTMNRNKHLKKYGIWPILSIILSYDF